MRQSHPSVLLPGYLISKTFFSPYCSTALYTLAASSVSQYHTQSVRLLGRGISPSRAAVFWNKSVLYNVLVVFFGKRKYYIQLQNLNF
jgi:hypothetical protein